MSATASIRVTEASCLEQDVMRALSSSEERPTLEELTQFLVRRDFRSIAAHPMVRSFYELIKPLSEWNQSSEVRQIIGRLLMENILYQTPRLTGAMSSPWSKSYRDPEWEIGIFARHRLA